MSMAGELARALFSPSSIALIGASGDEDKHTSLPQRFLKQHGYRGEIYPVNPRRDQIMGIRAYPNVESIGKPIDHAFIMVPAAAVPDVVEQCGAAGVRCATLLSAGFGEVGEEGRALQSRTVENARRNNIRLVGPNSLGMVNLNAGITLTANEVFASPSLQPGRTALISQSGSILGALVARSAGRGIGFSKMISVGNEADLGVGEIGSMLVDDPDTDAILLFLETIRGADSMRKMAVRAHELGKPIIAFRLGRSPLGEKLAQSHTGALTSNGAAIDAFLADIGIFRVDQIDTLIEMPALLARKPSITGRRVAVMTTTGGGGGLVVDCLSEKGVEIVPPDKRLIDNLAEKGLTISSAPLIDLTLAGTKADTYKLVLEELLASPHCDAVVAVVGSSAEFRPDRAVSPIIDVAPNATKPLAVFLTPKADRSHELLTQAGIATFRTPDGCADAVRAILERHAPKVYPPRASMIDNVEAALSGSGPGNVDLVTAMKVVTSLGISQPTEVLLPIVDRLTVYDLPANIRYPVVAKIVSGDIPHKTEAGGVILGVKSSEALIDAHAHIVSTVRKRRPDAKLEAIQVQSEEHGLAEALVGYLNDPNVGPVITLGAGGILAELYRDFATRCAPVDRATAREMIEEVKGLATIRGFRSLPKGDVEALADVIVAVSQLAYVETVSISEAEINPVLVRHEGKGVVALDALISIGSGRE